jgi:cytochrome c5
MNGKYSRISVLLAILVILLPIAAAGCGSKKDNKSKTSSTTASTPTPVVTESATSGSQVVLDGNALIDERCTQCHSRARIGNAQKDRAGWESTVDKMIGKGAVLNAEERQAVIDYLSSR